MKRYRYKLMLLGMFLSSSFSFGQFNTLKPIVQKKEEINVPSNSDKINSSENKKKKEEKKLWKKVFNTTTKADLKNEIDSLKVMIKENAASNNQKWNLKKVQDSLIWSAQINSAAAQKIAIANFDLVKEPKDYVSKTAMPLNRKIAVTSPYGTRIHPIFRTSKFHNGIDLSAHYENVHCVMDGIVTETGWDNKGGGNYIKINHFDRFETAYLHLSETYYRVGERVKAGFIIAKSGNTGNSTGPHLHFSVKELGQFINPSHFLNDLIKVNNLIATYHAN